MRGLNPDQRFQFDVRGYVVIEDAIDSRTLAELAPRLDVFEQAGQQYHRRRPDIVDERIDEVFGKKIGLHIQNSGQKLWIFDPLIEVLAAPLLLLLPCGCSCSCCSCCSCLSSSSSFYHCCSSSCCSCCSWSCCCSWSSWSSWSCSSSCCCSYTCYVCPIAAVHLALSW